MSDTEQKKSTPTPPKQQSDASSWAAKVDKAIGGKSIEELKSEVDPRSFTDKALAFGGRSVDAVVDMPKFAVHDPMLATKYGVKGINKSVYGTGGMLGDFVYRPLANAYEIVIGDAINTTINFFSGNGFQPEGPSTWGSLPGNNDGALKGAWNLIGANAINATAGFVGINASGVFFDTEGVDFTSYSKAADKYVESLNIAPEITGYVDKVVDGKTIQVIDPFADAKHAVEIFGMAYADVFTFPAVAMPVGAGVNVLKNGKIFKRGLEAAETFGRVKASTRLADAAELVEKGNKSLKKVEKIAKEMAEEAAKVGGKQGDEMLVKAEKLSKTIDDVRSGKVRYTKTGDGSETDKLLTKAQKNFDHVDDIKSGERTRTAIEDIPGNIASRIKGKPVAELRGAINTREDLANYIADKLTSTDPEIGKSLKSFFGKYNAENVRKVLRGLGEEGLEGASKKQLKALEKLEEELENVNIIAQRLGFEKFGVEEALNLGASRELGLDLLTWNERILHSAQRGAYRTGHVLDPMENPTMEALGTSAFGGWDFYVYKKEAAKSDATDRSLRVNEITRAAGEVKEKQEALDLVTKRLFGDDGNLTTTFKETNDAEEPKKSNPDRVLNGKEIEPIDKKFGDSATGAAIRVESEPNPATPSSTPNSNYNFLDTCLSPNG